MMQSANLLNAKLNPICYLLVLLGAHHIFHASGLRVNAKRKGDASVNLPRLNIGL
jgi:hypothetical protein